MRSIRGGLFSKSWTFLLLGQRLPVLLHGIRNRDELNNSLELLISHVTGTANYVIVCLLSAKPKESHLLRLTVSRTRQDPDPILPERPRRRGTRPEQDSFVHCQTQSILECVSPMLPRTLSNSRDALVLLPLFLLALSTDFPRRARAFPFQFARFRSRGCSWTRKMVAGRTEFISNWRVLHKDNRSDEDLPQDLLRKRERWSEAKYKDALDLYKELTSCPDSYMVGMVEQALNNLDHAYRLYGPESVICSFNGGKDAVVILHLVRAAHARFYDQQRNLDGNPIEPLRPRVVYFEHKDEFPEIRSFLREMVDVYELDMIAFEQGIKFSEGLKTLVTHNVPQNSNVSFPVAFVLGTRATDPNARGQGTFAPSSHYMPPFMRVNPVLEWTYGHVWHFLRLFHLPYCGLYDQGYTSLGTTKDTIPCPALSVPGGNTTNAIPRYWPAYMLRDWDQERAGRLSKPKANKTVDDTSSSASRTTQLSAMTVISKSGDVPREIDNLDVSDKTPLEDEDSVVSYTDTSAQKTVGVLIIGDEILKGLTADTNTLAAAKAFREKNVLLKRVVIVSDDSDEIIQEIHRLQNEVDVIITSGGVGPTHDDVTIKSVAAALRFDMVLHEEMADLLREKMSNDADTELTEAQVKMATLPNASKLRYLSDDPSDWPVLQCRNIFILPGVPEFFEKKIENVADYLSCQLERSVAYKVVLSADENSIVAILNEVVENHPMVSFGSYPFQQQSFKTVITVEAKMILLPAGRSNSTIFNRKEIVTSKSQMDRRVHLALDELINTLPERSVLRVDNDDMALSFS